ncbi:hypothetical protein PAJL_159 [Cutibacterium acnes HL042PA3]|nr:hypothetical protein TIIST44_08220 [Cutibacterium acnes subsp. defendens ATCC 11828]AID37051.1 hypothetical protein TIA1EST1_06335 [Cutibacterium acnes hdn-1]ESK59582.1 hypothetical protein PAJL_159 [Cutibacterium acnes HL042PA3]ESS86815.1 hypothetical protein H498_05165 [Cutibacterium acnes P6]KFC13783.1 hypothetical protein PAST2_08652 [Cutibacterium acnes HL202PA1]MCM4176979.1 hypothetical protein [Cutibacterium acnes P03]MCM4185392.1 hypothetical protein [Cutibacterium acnes P09]MCM41
MVCHVAHGDDGEPIAVRSGESAANDLTEVWFGLRM